MATYRIRFQILPFDPSAADDPIECIDVEMRKVGMPSYPRMYDLQNRTEVLIVAEYEISLYPHHRIFLVEFTTETSFGHGDVGYPKYWWIFCGEPIIGIGDRIIDFRMPPPTWDWPSVAKHLKVYGNITVPSEQMPSERSILEAVLNAKHLNPNCEGAIIES
jgi:hypothetical protein